MSVKDMLEGCAIVTVDNALLFTDGRYFLQAGKQLDELAIHVLGSESIWLSKIIVTGR
jgi:hypothetical protein